MSDTPEAVAARLLVCGGRWFSDQQFVSDTLDDLQARRGPFTVLIHGDAVGADRLAGQWAIGARVPLLAFPAQWTLHGRSAGPIRNKQMLTEGKPTLVLAFPGGVGTANMVRQARKGGIEVIEATP